MNCPVSISVVTQAPVPIGSFANWSVPTISGGKTMSGMPSRLPRKAASGSAKLNVTVRSDSDDSIEVMP
jgi:hypothetical protein